MDEQLDADFYIGDRGFFKLKLMEFRDLDGFNSIVKSKRLYKAYYYQIGVIGLLFKPYSKYLFTGELNCISTWFVLPIAKLLRKRIYLWSHGYYGNEGWIKKIFKKMYFALTAGVFLYGNHARNIMISQGIRENKLHLIYNSLNYDRQIAIRKKLSPNGILKNIFGNDFPTVVFIGRIQKVKRIDIVIHAIANLKKRNVDINLLLIGDSDASLNLKNLVNSLKLKENVCFYGPCYDEEKIGSFIYNADVCVSPGNIGLTAMHVLAYGTPILTNDNLFVQRPEFEAVTKGVTGDFFKENSIYDLEEKILQWINLSPQKREIVRQEAYKVIDEKYNPHRQIETLKAVLN
jgi:glycosyltransferase involved in cell wall biosynthesis